MKCIAFYTKSQLTLSNYHYHTMLPIRKRKKGTKDIPLASSSVPLATDVRRVVHNNRTKVIMQPLLHPRTETSTALPEPRGYQDVETLPSFNDDLNVVSTGRTWKVCHLTCST